jgi:hypothetical protein
MSDAVTPHWLRWNTGSVHWRLQIFPGDNIQCKSICNLRRKCGIWHHNCYQLSATPGAITWGHAYLHTELDPSYFQIRISPCFVLSKLFRNRNRPEGSTHAQCLIKQTAVMHHMHLAQPQKRTNCPLGHCSPHDMELDLITSHGAVRALNPDTYTFVFRLLLILHKYVFDSWVG